jgi:hypothetical protein
VSVIDIISFHISITDWSSDQRAFSGCRVTVGKFDSIHIDRRSPSDPTWSMPTAQVGVAFFGNIPESRYKNEEREPVSPSGKPCPHTSQMKHIR